MANSILMGMKGVIDNELLRYKNPAQRLHNTVRKLISILNRNRQVV